MAALLILPACGWFGNENTPSALDARSDAVQRLADLWWLMFWLGTGVFVAVLAMTAYALIRRRDRERDEASDQQFGQTLTVAAGIIIPIVILGVVLFASVGASDATSAPLDEPALTIEVIGYQFWWEVRYLDYGFSTANEIHIPVGQPVNIHLRSHDVIHSFWVPQIQAKRDMIPGEVNILRLQANEAGEFRGLCAEFCGLQHALMQFILVASPPDEFAAWVANQQQPAREPTTPAQEQGRLVYLQSSCVYCHAIRGVNDPPPTGVISPDLTHLASRRTLAAGAIANNTGNLGGWIVDPQGIKPGNNMPATNLTSEELRALLAYLESLE